MTRSASSSRSKSSDPLLRLFGVPAETFRETVAAQRPLFRRGDPARLEPVLGKGLLADLDEAKALAPLYRQPVQTMRFDRRGVLRCLSRRGEALRRLMEQDERCHFFYAYDTEFPRARRFRTALCKALGYGERGSSCRGSLHTTGAFVPRHCDDADVIIVQLVGTRLWRFEPNSDPPVGIEELVRMPRRLENGWSSEFGRASKMVRMTPGSVLYLPRGWWHELDSPGPSFALTFAAKPPLRRS
jgi:cupin superfamily protein